jgi:predicted DsbA family dithiol-disulfide isomerase
MSVEIFSDVVCPWCFIGKRRFDRALTTLADDADFPGADVVLRPFQLDPHAPRGPGRPALEAYARKFGGADRARQLVDRVTSIARTEGIEFHLERALRPNTGDAHRLLWWALRTAGPTVQTALNDELMTAYFTDGADLGDPEVLVERAARCGLDADAARAALLDEEGVEALAVGLRHAEELGITAVPTFVLNSRWSVPGAQQTEYFVELLRRVASR